MGREIADLSYRIGKWQKIVFVNDHITSREVDEIKVYTFEEVQNQFEKNDLEFIVAVGEPSIRKALYDKLASFKLNYIKIIDPAFYFIAVLFSCQSVPSFIQGCGHLQCSHRGRVLNQQAFSNRS